MEIKLIILGSVCAIAFARPIWGIAILLILTSSLFHLHQYATVPLPVGYVGPAEAILFSILLRIFWDRRQRGLQQFRNDESSTRGRFAKKVLISAILPYVIWQTICCARGILIWQGTEHFRFAIRFLISGVFTWSLVAIVWTMRHQAKDILRIALVVAFVTALVHIAIQLFDYRPIMEAAYWRLSEEYDFVAQSRERWLVKEDFVRGLPQGITLILYVLLYSFCNLLIWKAKNKSRTFMLMVFTTSLLAIAITFTRSLAAQAIAGCLAAVSFALILRLVRTQVIISRMALGVVGVLLVLAGYAAVKPGFSNFWKERIQSFDSADHKIFSEENKARGLDNISALNAIKDSPFFGCGTSRYPERYSFRDVPPTDIHPLLQVGLIGGILGMILIVRLQWVIFWRFWRASINDKEHQRQLIGYFSIIATTALVINLCGAGGTLSGNSLITMALFVGLMAAEFTNPIANTITSSKKHSERRFFT